MVRSSNGETDFDIVEEIQFASYLLILCLLYTHMQIHAHIYIYMLDTYRCNNKRQAKTSLEKYVPLTLL